MAGAAVSDQRGYDTYWKERFLGHPAANPEAYRRTSLPPYVDQLTRPLLIIQGLADTNVWPSHGHSISDPQTIENLLHLELAFLRRSLLG
ncbi:alpha/beta hydrolase family protein [Kribbella qitaiheensis]|uniref:alpha/beta hydrolase family protein n=1 Tax=Kribbella qitaiheensis TaxID=1544730 RepID=UPI00361B7A7A